MAAFLSVDLLTDFAAFCLTDFIDWRYFHSWFVFSTQLVNFCPQGRSNHTLLTYCCPSLYCTFSLTSFFSPPFFPMYSIYRQCVTGMGGGGGGECLNVLWSVDHILQEFYTLFLTRFRTYKIASPPLTKLTSKDDIEGLVSLKFLRPWLGPRERSRGDGGRGVGIK
jgi:hypothetical protein